jgi:Flp pilus assembly protein TadD
MQMDEPMGHAPEGMAPAVGPAGPPPEVEARLQDALRYAEELDWDGAATLLREGLSAHPDDPYLLCWLGMAERELGLEGVAHERFRRALEQDPRDPVLLATAGNALAAFDDPVAEGALRTAALLAPDLPQARWMYGAWLAREGMLEEALEELRAAEELDPEDGVIRTELGVALALMGNMEEAAGSFAAAVELEPEDAWALALLGFVRLEEGDGEAAARDLETAARLRTEDVDLQLVAALSLAAIGEDGRAFEMLERARLQVDEEGVDLRLVVEVEEHLEEGVDAASRFLRQAIGPSSFRERLMERP